MMNIVTKRVLIGLVLVSIIFSESVVSREEKAYSGIQYINPQEGSQGLHHAVLLAGWESVSNSFPGSFISVEFGAVVRGTRPEGWLPPPLEMKYLMGAGIGQVVEIGPIRIKAGGGVSLGQFVGDGVCRANEEENRGQCIDLNALTVGAYGTLSFGYADTSRSVLYLDLRRYYFDNDLEYDSVSLSYSVLIGG